MLQGSLMRTAAGLGWDGVYLLPGCCDPFNDKALRASRGAAFKLPIAVGDWQGLGQIAEHHNLTCFGAEPHDNTEKGPLAARSSSNDEASPGLAVVGLYLFSPDAAFAAGNAQLCRALMSLRSACLDTVQRDGDDAHGQARMTGVIEGRAFVHKRDSLKTAVAALKADLRRSLRARMAVVLMDAEDMAQSEDAKPELLQAGAEFYQSAFRLPMPQRALLHFKAPLCFSDYPLEEEADASVISTAQDLLALDVAQISQIDWPEGAASIQEAPELWQPLRTKAAVDKPVADNKASSLFACNEFVVGAVLVAGLGIAAGLAYIAM
ncbi:hypothetical protein COCSUDRAFT_46165 [Coccomyxa subellipsoidea C-169]|uniref:tRNA/rRNA methyltransferase SpoU type domain-containing protein n=1 Tax=Coccomyxa subellipsoidea (strain C-169) TaxID=574566 RepID=I0Z7L1_COCSC|nr:hypothetical protein COCSUDRAFT_46165 [Coccomyxa subellipsoidea C-169]EIE26630.1 hypothetical protein COCSUDRAFT_46165 [Coccomyxa subellipsoidea C-169]|eukprot:XP_005651174.1 hypothetical protein COCSUDRAFT_46165 [Coccomyxa subellipsoidea C-169]